MVAANTFFWVLPSFWPCRQKYHCLFVFRLGCGSQLVLYRGKRSSCNFGCLRVWVQDSSRPQMLPFVPHFWRYHMRFSTTLIVFTWHAHYSRNDFEICSWWHVRPASGGHWYAPLFLGGLVLCFIKPTLFYSFAKLWVKYITFSHYFIKIHFARPPAVALLLLHY